MIDAGHDPEHAAETVEQRHGQAYPVPIRKILMTTDPVSVVENIDVGEHDTLRETRCS